MASRRRADRRGLRVLGIALLILGTIRIPLPQADYHNVRHHHAPGEVCVYHDHLLRWHPSADTAADVPILHWHWVAPLIDPGAATSGDAEHGTTGPSLHAHLGDWPAPDWTGTPVLSPDSRGRLVDFLTLGHSTPNSLACHANLLDADPGSGPFLAWNSSCAAGPRPSSLILFSRWNC